MSAKISLGVLMPRIPEQRWSCHSCARCCFDLVGHLTDAERRRIDEQQWEARLGAAPYIRLGRSWVLNKRDNGACVFLDESNRFCRIHEQFGYDSKPLACRIYPFSVSDVSAGWRATLRFDCPSAARSQGEPIESYGRDLRAMALEAGRRADLPEDTPLLAEGLRATEDETRLVVGRFTEWMTRDRLSMHERLVGATGVACLLAQADLEHVRGSRFAELLDMLFAAAAQSETPAPPNPREDAMLRQWAFVHAERVSIAQMRASWASRMAHRLGQWRRSSVFRRGQGVVPPLTVLNMPAPLVEPALASVAARAVSFADVSAVGPASTPDAVREVDSLLTRFVVGRLSSRTAFGPDYFNWPIVLGLAALFGSLAVAGWLARLSAARAGRSQLSFDDVFEGLRVVDQAAGRAPLLGSAPERLRLEYLTQADGLTRLQHRWGMV